MNMREILKLLERDGVVSPSPSSSTNNNETAFDYKNRSVRFVQVLRDALAKAGYQCQRTVDGSLTVADADGYRWALKLLPDASFGGEGVVPSRF